MKDELHSQDELSVAAIAYIPPLWAVLLLFPRWRSNYYTRYHLMHGALLSVGLLLLVVLTGLISLWSGSWTGYNFLLIFLTGSLIGVAVLFGSLYMLYCAYNAYRGRYTVIPGISRVYYLLFSQRAVLEHNLYDSRRITHLRPYLKQGPADPPES
ncbi:MAG: hypothetical protein ACO1RX_17745 [Candidatus Sericytochromatia bacterium]